MARTLFAFFIVLCIRSFKYTSAFENETALEEESRINLVQLSPPVVVVTPLGLCEGDCDLDTDCGEGLYCFQRDEGGQAVPGCSGGEDDMSRSDFCTNKVDVPADTLAPIQPPVLQPTQAPIHQLPPVQLTNDFPLGLCEGDCDVDSDCDGNLLCFERDTYEVVPGCRGGESDDARTDYCIQASAINPTSPPTAKILILPSSEPSMTTTRFPSVSPSIDMPNHGLGLCEGDCDGDSDCASGLYCFERESNQAVPGCPGAEFDTSRTDYCTYISFPPSIQPSELPSQHQSDVSRAPVLPLELLKFYGEDPPEFALPLGNCEGDCDDDSDCQKDFFCFQRNSTDLVPGCIGGMFDTSRTDYCVSIAYLNFEPSNNPISSSPSISFTSSPLPVPSSLPSHTPSSAPSVATRSPSEKPSSKPSALPSEVTMVPSIVPSVVHSTQPSPEPSITPTFVTLMPSTIPTTLPSAHPTSKPSPQPSSKPSAAPTYVTLTPSTIPTTLPSAYPTSKPSTQPTAMTMMPSTIPSFSPSTIPSDFPSLIPSGVPSDIPSGIPSGAPSVLPSASLSTHPSLLPTADPDDPSKLASTVPTMRTLSPSVLASAVPTKLLSDIPSISPSSVPTTPPTPQSSDIPSKYPSSIPSEVLSSVPSTLPSKISSSSPSESPTRIPSSVPSTVHSGIPSMIPSSEPSNMASGLPSNLPTPLTSSQPSGIPTAIPSLRPSLVPSKSQTPSSSKVPTNYPSQSLLPSTVPSRPLGTLGVVLDGAEKLGHCEGDCDNDEDCGEGLYCFQRDANDEVPSCIGGAEDHSRTDYCTYIFPSQSPSVAPSESPSISARPSTSIQPSHPPTRMISAVPSTLPSMSLSPTSYPSPNPSKSPSTVPSFLPSPRPSAIPSKSLLPSASPSRALGEVTTFPPGALQSNHVFGLCEGDCDTDDDCGEGLYCFQRTSNEDVPGCIGGNEDNSWLDYCTYVSFAPVAAPTSNFFRLKLHWEATYSWSVNGGATKNNWCLDCDGGCFPGSTLFASACSGISAYFEFWELPTDDLLIEVSNANLCIQRSGNEARLFQCDPTNPLQRWQVTFADGEVDSAPYFEISQFVSGGNCMTLEQPQHAEPLLVESCSNAIAQKTSFWERY